MNRRQVGIITAAGAILLALAAPAAASGSAGSAEPQLISDSQLSAKTTTMGGANPLPTTRTVAHWWGSSVNPDNGVTYGYSMVGADPNACIGFNGTATT